MARALLLAAAFLLQSVPSPAPPAPRPAARVLAAVAAAARENAALPAPKRTSGDALLDLYARRAAAAAADPGAFLEGLAAALDLPSPSAAEGLETAEEAKARRRDLGEPTLRGRADLLRHFLVSALLVRGRGAAVAEAAGLAKEAADATPGGSGFSFADLLADLAGIRFAAWLAGKDPGERLARLAREFRGDAVCPDPKGLPEGIREAELAREWGGPSGKRLLAEVESLRARVEALPLYAPPPAPGK